MAGLRRTDGALQERSGTRRWRVLTMAALVVITLSGLTLVGAAGSVSAARRATSSTLTWSDTTPPPTSPGNVAGEIAYDTATSQLVLLDQSQTANGFYDTWIWNGATWSPRRLLTNPNGSGTALLAYDGATSQLLLFIAATDDFNGSVWSWNGSSWSEAESGVQAIWFGGSMAYDPATKQLVLVTTGAGTLVWNGSAFADVPTVSSPSPRFGAALAYDPATSSLVLFGGTSSDTDNGVFSDTWSFDGTNWNELKPTTSPPARRFGSMAYDEATSKLVLYGGVGSAGATRYDTWAYSGSAWAQTTGGSVSANEQSSMAYDEATRQLVLYGGAGPAYPANPDDTWIRAGQSWSGGAPAPSSPEPGVPSSMAYDQATGQMLYFAKSETWLWRAGGWVHLDPKTVPPPQYGTIAYDPAAGEVILFEPGVAGVAKEPSTLWDWNGTTWSELHPRTTAPSPTLFALAYDSSMKAVVLVGVFDGVSIATWSWNGSNWTELSTWASPSGRSEFSLADDPASGQLLLYGGMPLDGNTPLGDTWALAGGTWINLAPTTAPPLLAGAAMTYDPATRELILFGGETCCKTGSPDTWAWNGSGWADLSPPTSPVDRTNPAMAYDPATKQVVLYGGDSGTGGGEGYGDTWTYSSAAIPAPQITSVVAGNGQVTVSWKPPDLGPGVAIDGYQVDDAGVVPVAGSNPYIDTATVNGLANGWTYTFTVTPVGENGSYAPSAPSAPVVPRVNGS